MVLLEKMGKKWVDNSGRKNLETQVNLFELGTALVLLSDSRITQKSQLLIALFDTNENYIIGDNELHILVRCCLVAILLLDDQSNEVSTQVVHNTLEFLKSTNRYTKSDGISVTDFTHFLMESSPILGLLNDYGLFW